jgi:quercetin dioxygenase-like cupin family protein/DNA-binding Xre family transcriptional regulator
MTDNLAEFDTDTLRGLGERIKNLRGDRGLTLTALSAKSGISVAMLSHIERGKTSPSLKLLDRLRVALGVPLASFFDIAAERSVEEGVITRADKRSMLRFDTGLTKEMLSPLGHSDLEVLQLSVQVGGSSGPDPWRRVGEKAGVVLEGRFELQIGEQIFTLEKGDAFQFDSSQPHSFRNVAPTTTKVIWIIKSNEAG